MVFRSWRGWVMGMVGGVVVPIAPTSWSHVAKSAPLGKDVSMVPVSGSLGVALPHFATYRRWQSR